MAPHALKKRRLNSPSAADTSFDHAASNDSDSFMEETSIISMAATKTQLRNGTDNKSQATRMPLPPANGAHSSSLLKLQADGLLETLRHEHEKWAKSVENALRRLKATIEHIEEHDPIPVRSILDIGQR